MAQTYTVRAIIEILGAPKDHVLYAMGLVEQKVKDHKQLRKVTTKLFPAKEAPMKDEQGKALLGIKPGTELWTTFCECEFQVDDLDVLFGFCFDFMPSSLEVTDPETIKLDALKINNLLNDLAARLHFYDMHLKQMRIKNMLLEKKLGLSTEQKK